MDLFKDESDYRSWPFVSEALCVEKMHFAAIVIAALGGKPDSTLASMDQTNINIATHTLEVTGSSSSWTD